MLHFGYFGAGPSPSAAKSTVDRIDYSNDTADGTRKRTIKYC